MLLADNLEQRVITLATFGNFSFNAEAQQYFNITIILQKHIDLKLSKSANYQL